MGALLLDLIRKFCYRANMLIKRLAIVFLSVFMLVVTISSVIAEEPPQTLQNLIKKLQDEDPSVRRKAIETILITEYRGQELVDPLIGALKDENHNIRASAAKILGEIRDPKAVDPLIATIKDDYMEVRLSTIRALGLIGDKKAVDPIIGSLQDTQSEVVREAISALQYFKDERAVTPLAKLAVESDEFLTRSASIRALRQIGSQKAVDPLIDALGKEKDIWIKLDIVTTLGSLGDPKAISAIRKVISEFNQELAKDIPEDNKAIYRDIIKQMNETVSYLEKTSKKPEADKVEKTTPSPKPSPSIEAPIKKKDHESAFNKVDVNDLPFTIQVGSFKDIKVAKKTLDRLSSKTSDVYIKKSDLGNKGIWYRVRIGKFNSREKAEAYAKLLKKKNIISTYIVTNL